MLNRLISSRHPVNIDSAVFPPHHIDIQMTPWTCPYIETTKERHDQVLLVCICYRLWIIAWSLPWKGCCSLPEIIFFNQCLFLFPTPCPLPSSIKVAQVTDHQLWWSNLPKRYSASASLVDHNIVFPVSISWPLSEWLFTTSIQFLHFRNETSYFCVCVSIFFIHHDHFVFKWNPTLFLWLNHARFGLKIHHKPNWASIATFIHVPTDSQP